MIEDLTFLESEWQPGEDNYRAEFINNDPKETLSAFEMSSERMAVALDSGNQEDEHSCFSDTTYQDFLYNAQGIYNVYLGNYQGYEGKGFNELVAQVNPSFNQQVIAALETTKTAISQINQPFDQILVSPQGSPEREEVETAITALTALT